MKDWFSAFYEQEELDKPFWESTLIAFDANVLLNVYSLGDKPRARFFEIWEHFRGQVFIPYQAALEYHRNLSSRIDEQDAVLRELQKMPKLRSYRDTLKDHGEHPFFDMAGAAGKVSDLIAELETVFKAAATTKATYMAETKNIKDKIGEMIDGKVGNPYGVDALEMLASRAEARRKLGMPPGLSDLDKPTNSLGDIVIWHQILDRVRHDPKPVLFITDEKKADWWLKKGDALRANPELSVEMKAQCHGARFEMLRTETFLVQASKHLGLPIDKQLDDLISEVRIAIAEQESRRSQTKSIIEQAIADLGPDAELYWNDEAFSAEQAAHIVAKMYSAIDDFYFDHTDYPDPAWDFYDRIAFMVERSVIDKKTCQRMISGLRLLEKCGRGDEEVSKENLDVLLLDAVLSKVRHHQ